jgi:hypothetical protein
MSDVALELFAEFLGEREAGGEPDPVDYLERAGDAADALAGMLAAYLATHPRTQVSEEAVEALAARVEVPPPPWSELLPALREERGKTRGALVHELAAELGYPEATEKVAVYVHELETGQLSPLRVRRVVVEALARLLDVSREFLDAARRAEAVPPVGPELAFARPAPVGPLRELHDLGPSAGDGGAAMPDEVDDLFTRGDRDRSPGDA